MKAYGIPRTIDTEAPDVADIHRYGLPGRAGRAPGPSGDIRGYFRSPASKATTRRIWKRLARIEGRQACRLDVEVSEVPAPFWEAQDEAEPAS